MAQFSSRSSSEIICSAFFDLVLRRIGGWVNGIGLFDLPFNRNDQTTCILIYQCQKFKRMIWSIVQTHIFKYKDVYNNRILANRKKNVCMEKSFKI